MESKYDNGEVPQHTMYVLGFAFSADGKVLLIRKNRPECQKNKLNGIGGHVEYFDESILHAMVREFKEETGYTSQLSSWRYVHEFSGNYYNCYCYMLEDALTQTDVMSITDEKLEWHDVNNLPDDLYCDKTMIMSFYEWFSTIRR